MSFTSFPCWFNDDDGRRTFFNRKYLSYTYVHVHDRAATRRLYFRCRDNLLEIFINVNY